MTIVPNLLVTGILAILFSLAFPVWAALFVERKNGGLVLILLAAGMLLFGGGIFPPVIGILIGILATEDQCAIIRMAHPFPGGIERFSGKAMAVVFRRLRPGLAVPVSRHQHPWLFLRGE